MTYKMMAIKNRVVMIERALRAGISREEIARLYGVTRKRVSSIWCDMKREKRV